jgi:hypothetical protein
MLLRKLKKTTRIKYQDILAHFKLGTIHKDTRSFTGREQLLSKDKYLVVPELLKNASSTS